MQSWEMYIFFLDLYQCKGSFGTQVGHQKTTPKAHPLNFLNTFLANYLGIRRECAAILINVRRAMHSTISQLNEPRLHVSQMQSETFYRSPNSKGTSVVF